MDLDRILLPALVLTMTVSAIRASRIAWPAARGWVINQLIVAAVALAAVVTGWPWGLEVSVLTCLVLFVVPLVSGRYTIRAIVQMRYARALTWAQVAKLCRPFDQRDQSTKILRAKLLLDRNEIDAAIDLLRSLEDESEAPNALLARLLRLQATHDRQTLDRWLDGLPGPVRAKAMGLPVTWTLVAGQIGRPEIMLQRYTQTIEIPLVHHMPVELRLLQLGVAAYCGQVQTVELLLSTPSQHTDLGQIWRCTALITAGRADEVQEDLARLKESPHWQIRMSAQRLVNTPPPPVDRAQLSEGAQATLGALETSVAEAVQVGGLMRPARGPTRATYLLVALLVAAYCGQSIWIQDDLGPGLFALGALLTPFTHPDFEAWRILSAGWLHVGAVHLFVNALGLWLFGRFVEANLSPPRFLIIYFVGGWLGLGFAALMGTLGGPGPHLIVGASGGVMAIFGAGTYVLVRSWRKVRDPYTKARMGEAVLVIFLQFASDLMTPYVSTSTHMGGLIAGFALAALLSPRRTAPKR